jgi:hypothetical protein
VDPVIVHGAAAHIPPTKSFNCHLDAPGQDGVMFDLVQGSEGEDIPPAPRVPHESPMCGQHPHFAKVISRPFPGWLECLAESGPSGLEGDEVARHPRHRVTRPFVGRRGANVRDPTLLGMHEKARRTSLSLWTAGWPPLRGLHRVLGPLSRSAGPTSAGRGPRAWGQSQIGFF